METLDAWIAGGEGADRASTEAETAASTAAALPGQATLDAVPAMAVEGAREVSRELERARHYKGGNRSGLAE